MAKNKKSGKRSGKKRQSLKKIYQINKHNANAKKKRNDVSVDPFREEFLPKLQKKSKTKIVAGQKASRRMAKVLDLMQSVKQAEQQQREKLLENREDSNTEHNAQPAVVVTEDGEVLDAMEHREAEQSRLNAAGKSHDDPSLAEKDESIEDLVGRDYESLSRKQRQKIKRRMLKDKKKMQKMEKSLKKMYRKDKNLEIDQDFAVRLGEDEVDFGDEVKAPPQKDVFSKKKAKLARSRAANMTEEQLKRFNLRQIAIQRNMELQMQKAKQMYSEKRKREMVTEYAEFTESW